MNITVNSENLSKALKTAFKVIPTKAVMPLLECFLLEAKGKRLVITASNAATSVLVPVTISQNEEDGVCAVPAKKFFEHVSLLPSGEVNISTSENTIKITWAKGSTKMQLMDASDYPPISIPSTECSIDIPAQQLAAALSSTIPMCSKDDLHPQLCGVHFDVGESFTRVVGSDMRSLTYDILECGGEAQEFTVPATAASLVRGAIRKEASIVRLTHDGNNICFNLGDVIIISRKITAKYPRYMTIIPKEGDMSGEAVLCREVLMGTLRRLSACSQNVTMTMEPLSILFNARNTETGSCAEEDCECSYNGEEITIGVNSARFLSVLESINSEEVSIAVSTPRKPILMRPCDEGAASLSLFMPVSIQ